MFIDFLSQLFRNLLDVEVLWIWNEMRREKNLSIDYMSSMDE